MYILILPSLLECLSSPSIVLIHSTIHCLFQFTFFSRLLPYVDRTLTNLPLHIVHFLQAKQSDQHFFFSFSKDTFYLFKMFQLKTFALASLVAAVSAHQNLHEIFVNDVSAGFEVGIRRAPSNSPVVRTIISTIIGGFLIQILG